MPLESTCILISCVNRRSRIGRQLFQIVMELTETSKVGVLPQVMRKCISLEMCWTRICNGLVSTGRTEEGLT